MPFEKYRAPCPRAARPGWPDRQLTKAPRWASVDLRDGNQALDRSDGPRAQAPLFETSSAMGFKEIEVGFPSA